MTTHFVGRRNVIKPVAPATVAAPRDHTPAELAAEQWRVSRAAARVKAAQQDALNHQRYIAEMGLVWDGEGYDTPEGIRNFNRNK